MPNTKTDTPAEKPLDPEMEKIRRKMVRTLVISIGTMVIGLMAVAGAIVYKVSSGSNGQRSENAGGRVPAQAPQEAAAALPAGFSVSQVALDGSRILLFGKAADGSMHAYVYDTAVGRLTADVTVAK